MSAWRLARFVPRSLALRVALGATGLYAACVGLTALTYRSFLFPAPQSGLAPTVSGAELLRSDISGIPVVALYAPPRADQSVVVFSTATAKSWSICRTSRSCCARSWVTASARVLLPRWLRAATVVSC